MSIQKETELYEPIKAYFMQKGYSVKSEVRHCDMVAVSDTADQPVIVEFKKTLTIPLLLQGIERQKMTPHVYIAVEYKARKKGSSSPKWSEYTSLCRRLGLGLLSVQFFARKPARVELWCTPQVEPVLRPKQSIRTKRLLHEFHERSGDYNVGGSSQTEIITAYRELALKCALELKHSGPTKLSHLAQALNSRKVNAVMQDNFYGWFTRVQRGVYDITDQGRQALEQYQSIIKQWP